MTAAHWTSRLAAWPLVVVGVLNVALGLLSLLTDQIRLPVGAAGGLVTAGLVMAAVGVLVARGSRFATIAAFTVFTMLLVLQVGDLVADTGVGGTSPEQHPLTRFAVLGLLVATLAPAAWRLRGRTPVGSRDHRGGRSGRAGESGPVG